MSRIAPVSFRSANAAGHAALGVMEFADQTVVRDVEDIRAWRSDRPANPTQSILRRATVSALMPPVCDAHSAAPVPRQKLVKPGDDAEIVDACQHTRSC
jgi:hypothetical protein